MKPLSFLLISIAIGHSAMAQYPVLDLPVLDDHKQNSQLRSAVQALQAGNAQEAEKRSEWCIEQGGGEWAYYVHAHSVLMRRDTTGYCLDMEKAMGLPKDRLQEFTANCTSGDSGSTEHFNLSTAHFPGIVNVAKFRWRTDGSLHFKLYDAMDSVRAAFEVHDQDTSYSKVDKPARFGKEDKVLWAWLSKNVNYPGHSMDAGIQGKVYVRFVVDEHGSIGNVKILRSPADDLSAEVLRVFALMPDWTPAEVFGRPVEAGIIMPVAFKLQ